MLSLVLIAATLVGLVMLGITLSRRRSTSQVISPARMFVLLSPLPLVLTVLVPLMINLATSFQGGRAIYAFSIAGCVVSVAFVFAGIILFVGSWMTGRTETLLVPATILSSIPALILVFIYLFGFGGALRR